MDNLTIKFWCRDSHIETTKCPHASFNDNTREPNGYKHCFYADHITCSITYCDCETAQEEALTKRMKEGY